MNEFLDTIKSADLVLVGIGEECDISIVESKELYGILLKLLKDKNYFIVTTSMTGEIHNYDFLTDRIVEPCGSYLKLQCSDACRKEVYPISDKLEKNRCPVCKKELVYNICTQERYVEEGYLPQWEIYTKWLQGTLNKKLCILELGVGINYPTVIRWPFEKIAFFNQKSTFYRVHSKLPQVTEGLGERAKSIFKKPYEFLKEI